MTKMLRSLSTGRFQQPQSVFSPGPAPQLQWLEVTQLVVDGSYQREIGKRGATNIRQIAENFDWSKFAPVIVAPVEGGQYAIVDGQHRCTAALLRSIERVPCYIVQADRAKQAAAYAAVNGHVTKTTAQQLFHARVTAGEPEAHWLERVCRAGDVTIVRRNVVVAKMTVGQTQAVGALARCLRDYGEATLITALQCITRTADGNAGYVRATIIEGLCDALAQEPKWRDAGEALLAAMDKFSFPDLWSEVSEGRDQIFPSTARKQIAERVRKHLAKDLVSRPSTPRTRKAA